MAKEELIEMHGLVDEVLPDSRFASHWTMDTNLWLIHLEKCARTTFVFWRVIRYHWSYRRMT